MKNNIYRLHCAPPSSALPPQANLLFTSYIGKGFTLLELIAATTILAIVTIGTVQATISSLRLFNQAAARDAMETTISNDLRWISAYSKSWHCQVGPYQGCIKNTQGLASSVNYLPEIYSEATDSAYAKFKLMCNNRADSTSTQKPSNQFITDAANAAALGLSPPPNPIKVSEQELTLSDSPINVYGYRLYRNIDLDSSGNGIDVSYYTKSTDSPTLKLHKNVKLFIEATAWCP